MRKKSEQKCIRHIENNNIIKVSAYPSVITLNVIEFNSPIKGYSLAKCTNLRMLDSKLCYHKTNCRSKVTHR